MKNHDSYSGSAAGASPVQPLRPPLLRQWRNAVAMGLAMLIVAITGVPAQAQYLMVPDSASSTTAPSGAARIMLFSAADGSLVDANFIPNATSPYTFATPKEIYQVGNEIWVSDQVANAVFCFTATYDPANSIRPIYVRTINGGMSNMRGLAVLNDRVYITNAGTANGAPGVAMLVYESSGAFASSFPLAGASPVDCSVLGGRLLVSDLLDNNIRLYNSDGTLFGLFRNNTATGNIRSAQQVNVFTTGPGGAEEIWAAGGSPGPGVYRYDSTGATQVAYYNVGLGVKGVWVLGNGDVLFTDQTASGATTGNVRKFTPGVAGITTILGSGTAAGTGIVPQFISPFTPGPPSPTNPFGAGTFQPSANQLGVFAGTTTLLTVNVTPGTTPTSTGILVNADLSAFGGSASQPFADQGNNVFTYSLAIPAGQTGGDYNVRLTIGDAQTRVGGGNIRMTVVGLPPAGYTQEVEPNDTKATSQAIALSQGLGIWGVSTGAATAAGIGSADNYLVTAPAAAPGIYRNSITLTTPGTAGHVGTIRGLTQTAGVVNAGTDAAAQTSSLNTVPPRSCIWYGFGKQERLYYRVQGVGAPATAAEYLATFQSVPVTPTLIEENIGDNSNTTVTIARDASSTQTLDMWLYDSNYSPLADGGYEGTASFTRTLAPGAYYLAVSNTNTANNLAQPSDSPNRASPVLDFPNAILNNSPGTVTSVPLNLNLTIAHSRGVTAVPVGKTYSFDVMWFKFYVGSPANPQADASATPNPVIASDTAIPGGASTQILVHVVPGSNPPSTGLTVTADLSELGGAASQALSDFGGGLYGYTLAVGAAQAPGTHAIAITAADAQGRHGNTTLQLGVLATPPAGFVLESEDNDFKFNADNAQIAPGQGVYGFSTGDLQGAGAGGPDYFLLQVASQAPAIYRQRMIITTSGTAGHTGSLRGLRQNDGVIDQNIDSNFQTSLGGSNPPRFNQWYGFGQQEQMLYRVSGGAGTTQEYVSTLESVRVTPIPFPGTIPSGEVSITRDTLNVTAVDMWLYDASLHPIAEAGSQGNNVLTRTLPAGTYYLAVSDVNTANDQASPADSASRNSDVLEFPGAIANNSAAGGLNMSMRIAYNGGESHAGGVKDGPFDVVWYQINTADGAFCPADFNGDGGVDGSDVESFFSAWEAGDSNADVNLDGGIDGSDVETFFAAWEAGGC